MSRAMASAPAGLSRVNRRSCDRQRARNRGAAASGRDAGPDDIRWARPTVGGRVEEVGGMDVGGLLGVVDDAAGLPEEEIPSAEGRGAALP